MNSILDELKSGNLFSTCCSQEVYFSRVEVRASVLVELKAGSLFHASWVLVVFYRRFEVRGLLSTSLLEFRKSFIDEKEAGSLL